MIPPFAPQQRLHTFRDTVRKISPPWLQRGTGEAVLYAIALQLDALTDGLVAAIKLRFPGLYSYDTLGIIGRERRIRRGRFESPEAYVPRLLRWLDDHRERGGPFALLRQLHAHYAPNNFPIELRYASGRSFQMDAAGNVTMSDVSWSPPGGAARWARWWLFYQWPTPVDDDGTWNDPGTWNDGGVWDSNLAPTEVRDLRLIPREWNAQHATGRMVLMTPLKTVNFSAEGA